MIPRPIAMIFIFLLTLASLSHVCRAEMVMRVEDKQRVDFSRMIAELGKSDVVMLGEDHDKMLDHWRQIKVLKALRDSGANIAIGLEMFTSRDQQELDKWVDGRSDEHLFATQFQNNWNNPWTYYRDIFLFAQRHRIPMIGLNLPREVTRKVASQGFASLPAEDRVLIPGTVTCQVEPSYLALVKRAFIAHGMAEREFLHFCEAQLLWNKVMAWNAVEYMKKSPGTIMVILAGKGHAMRGAIPTEIGKMIRAKILVVLPEDQIFTRAGVGSDDADYLFLK